MRALIDEIGFVWPAMVLFSIIMLAMFVFAFLLRAFPNRGQRADHAFLQRIIKVLETVTSLAILAGMIGTAKGLIDVMPELSKVLSQEGNGSIAVGRVIGSLTNVFASTFCGLLIASLGEFNQLLLNFSLDSMALAKGGAPARRFFRSVSVNESAGKNKEPSKPVLKHLSKSQDIKEQKNSFGRRLL